MMAVKILMWSVALPLAVKKALTWAQISDTAFSVDVGCLIGYSGLLANNRALFQIIAESDSYVGFLPRAKVREIITRYPNSLFAMGERLLEVLPSVVKLVDFAVDWMQVGAGKTVYTREQDR